MKLFCLVIAIMTHTCFFSQEIKDEVHVPRRLGIGMYAGGPSLLFGVSLAYFIAPKTSFEIGGGAVGFYGGIKQYIGKMEKKWSPFIGLNVVGYYDLKFFGPSTWKPMLNIPIGFRFIGDNGFEFSFSADYNLIQYEGTFPRIWGTIKLGYCFNSKNNFQ